MAHRPPNNSNLIPGYPLPPRGVPFMSNMTYPTVQPGYLGMIPQPMPAQVYTTLQQTMGPMGTSTACFGMQQRIISPEEQRRLEEKARREHHYQMQQQRLRALNTSCCTQRPTDPDTLIQNMFGKREFIKPKPTAISTKQDEKKKSNAAPYKNNSPGSSEFQNISEKANQSITTNSEIDESKNQPNKSSPVTSPHLSSHVAKKGLEAMMLECSDLSKPSRAHTFPKPKNYKQQNQNLPRTSDFQSNPKSQHFQQTSEYGAGFSGPGLPKESKPAPSGDIKQSHKGMHDTTDRLPNWCFDNSQVPDAYQILLQMVSPAEVIDTSLLYPLLVSSGLSRDVLGHIWALVNMTIPGQLLRHELFAALALIALAQSGCKFHSLDILHSVPQPPVPILQHPAVCPIFSTAVAVTASPTQISTSDQSNTSLAVSLQTKEKNFPPEISDDDDFADFQSAPPPSSVSAVNSKSIPVGSSVVGSRLANYSSSPILNSPAHTQENLVADNDFSEFQHAEYTSDELKKEVSTSVDKYAMLKDIDTSKESKTEHRRSQSDGSALLVTGKEELSDNVTKPQSLECLHNMLPNYESQSTSAAVPDLMIPREDKYSVFRELELQQQKQQQDSPVSIDINNQDEEFGDFLTSTTTDNFISSSNSNVKSVNSRIPTFGNVFSGSSVPLESPLSKLRNPDICVKIDNNSFDNESKEEIDDEFGDYISPGDMTKDGDIFPMANHSQWPKDTVSLESQSVSSLDLGTYDGMTLGNELFSNLSRQGSVPSLDLKVTSSENDEEFGDLQSGFSELSVGMQFTSTVTDVLSNNGISGTNTTVLGSNKTSFPLVDRYSMVRASDELTPAKLGNLMLNNIEDTDRHVYEWQRCLKSCYQLIKNANNIFNGISSSQVCSEIVNTEEGSNYIKNIIEIYRLTCRLALSVGSSALENEMLNTLLNEIDTSWKNLSAFINGCSLLPQKESLDFTEYILKADPENNEKACGVCLLNVNSPSQGLNNELDSYKFSYGGRNYHATCANFWVNCVDSLLPALTFQQLL